VNEGARRERSGSDRVNRDAILDESGCEKGKLRALNWELLQVWERDKIINERKGFCWNEELGEKRGRRLLKNLFRNRFRLLSTWAKWQK